MKTDIVVHEFSQHIEIEERWVSDEGAHCFSTIDVYHEDIDELVNRLNNIRARIGSEYEFSGNRLE